MAEVRITKADDGRTVEVSVGDVVTIELEENPTTGFRWAEADTPAPFEAVDTSYTGAVTENLGAPGTRQLRYRTADIGEGRLTLRYWQEWEGESSTADTFSLKVVARK